MGKYLYVLKRFNFNSVKTLFKISKKVKKISKKHFVIPDMIYCFIKYQAAFYDYLEFEFYSLKGKERATYLTNGKNNALVKKYNDKAYFHILDNKDEFNDYFKEYIKRDYLKPNFSKKNLESFLEDKEKVIVKPIDGVGGEGIEIVDSKTVLKKYDKYKSYLIEEVIKQHHKLNKLYPNSVNSIRVFSFYDGKNTHILQSILKIGNNTIVDNFSSGGMYTFLDDKGFVVAPAIDKDDNTYAKHPITNIQIVGFQVPLFKEVKELIENAAKTIPQIKYIGWDVAITDNGPELIEGNSYPGVFQIKPRFKNDKLGILPKYKQIMNESQKDVVIK